MSLIVSSFWIFIHQHVGATLGLGQWPTAGSCNWPHFLTGHHITTLDKLIWFGFFNWNILGHVPLVSVFVVTFEWIRYRPALSYILRVLQFMNNCMQIVRGSR